MRRKKNNVPGKIRKFLLLRFWVSQL